ncbi:MAG: hypothetical protein HKN46_07460 [Acidimicrobiia bacterium]|nr:hypothetical protein [Acidimicrobiia bacterium]
MDVRARFDACEGAGVNDRGSAPIELAAGLGLLVLPIAIAILIAPSWLAARNGADAAAQSAATAISTGSNDASGEATARALVEGIAASRSIAVSDLEFCPPRGTCLPLGRGDVIEVRVEVRAAPIDLPGLVSLGSVVVEGRGHASVDPYRSLP